MDKRRAHDVRYAVSFKKAIADYLAKRGDIQDFDIEVVEETEDEKIVREIMEEEQDEIRVKITTVLPPIEYISMKFEVKK